MEYVFLYLIGVAAMTLGTLAGGGGLITVPAMMLMGFPIHSTIGAGKISTTFSSFSAFLTVLFQKRVTWKESFWIIPISLSGGAAGGIIANRLTESTLTAIALTLLTAALLLSFAASAPFTGDETLRPSKKGAAGLMGIGLYDGMFGPGQGTLLLYLFSYLQMSYSRAIGFVRLANFSSGSGAAISFVIAGKIIWPMALALLAGSLTGAQIGVRLTDRLNRRHVAILLRTVTVLLIIQLTIQFVV